MPYEDVARLAHGALGRGEVCGAAAQGAAGLGGGVPGLLEGAGVGLGLLLLLVGVLPQQVPEQGGRLVEATGRVLGGAVRVEQLGVRLTCLAERLGAGGEFTGGRAQQRLRVLGVARDQFLRQLGVGLAVLGRVPLGLAAQPPELLARGGHAGLQELDELLGTGGRGLPGRPVGTVRRLKELCGARAHLVAEPVQLCQGRGLVALGAGLLGAQIGADADLLVQL